MQQNLNMNQPNKKAVSPDTFSMMACTRLANLSNDVAKYRVMGVKLHCNLFAILNFQLITFPLGYWVGLRFHGRRSFAR
jgi:hypothetical protein